MRWLALGLGVLLLAGAPPADGHPVKEAIKEKQKALGEVQRRIRQERARADVARQKEESLLAELEATDRTLAVKRQELRRLDARLQRLEGELKDLEGNLGQVSRRLTAQQEAAALRLRTLYRLVATGPGPLLDPEDEARARAARALRALTVSDLRLIGEYGAHAERLATRQEEVERHRLELQALRREGERERAAIHREAERRRDLLARVRDDRATHERMARELEEARRRLEVLIRELGRKAAAARPPAGAPAAPGVGFGALRGQLPWPAAGRIAAGFGRQVHPRFGTETQRNGVDIEAEEGSQIQAVYAGTVLYSGWFKGYGNLIILDHGHGYSTVYAHASEILVQEGERVSQGQVIGRVGETGSLDGPRLYFEVRAQGRPEDPQQWLRHRL